MTLTMNAVITFDAAHGRAKMEIRQVSEITIERSWKEFTGRAEIIMPRNIKILNNQRNVKYSDIFKNGDPVEIRLGYGAELPPVEFSGYISDVSEGVPVVIRCEDEAYKLKRGNVSIVSGSITLKKLLEKACVGYKIDCDNVNLGAVRFSNVAPIAILEQIKKDTGLYSYFDSPQTPTGGKPILRCGVIYSDQSDAPVVNIHLEKNAVSESLNKKAETDEVEIKAISILKNGKKISATVGRKGGTNVQRTYIGITIKAELEKRAKADLKKYEAQGFDGSITLFGIPRVEHGLKLHIKSELYKNMEGTFYIVVP